MWNVGSNDGADVGAGVGKVDGTADGTAVSVVGSDVGAAVGMGVSSSRRAPSRRPLDRRAFGPLRGGRCPPTTALRNKHRHRQAIIMRMNDSSPLLDLLWAAVPCRIPGL